MADESSGDDGDLDAVARESSLVRGYEVLGTEFYALATPRSRPPQVRRSIQGVPKPTGPAPSTFGTAARALVAAASPRTQCSISRSPSPAGAAFMSIPSNMAHQPIGQSQLTSGQSQGFGAEVPAAAQLRRGSSTERQYTAMELDLMMTSPGSARAAGTGLLPSLPSRPTSAGSITWSKKLVHGAKVKSGVSKIDTTTGRSYGNA